MHVEYEVDFTLDGRRLSYVDVSVGNVELARSYCENEGRSLVQVDSDRFRLDISDQLHKIEVSMSWKVLNGDAFFSSTTQIIQFSARHVANP